MEWYKSKWVAIAAGAGALIYLYLTFKNCSACLVPSFLMPKSGAPKTALPVVTPHQCCHTPTVHPMTPAFVPTLGNPALNVYDSVVNGVDAFQASGGITPDASGDKLLSSFTGTDGIVQYEYQRPNGNTYTTTIKNPAP